MSLSVIAIPASPFLRQRMAGLTGIGRSVIVADQAGASRIVIVGEDLPAPDWLRSFALRERRLPRVANAVSIDQIDLGADERLLELPGDCLLTAAGIGRLAEGAAPDELARPADRFDAGTPREVTWQILQASMKPGEGWVGRHLNRPISFRIAAWLLRYRVTPDMVTWATFVLAALMFALMGWGGVQGLMFGGFLYQVVSVVDCVDGDIARVSYQTSRRGATLDTALDMLANLGFFFGLMTGLVKSYGPGQLALAGTMAVGAALCMALMTILVRIGPRRGSFDVLRAAMELRLVGMPRFGRLVMTIEKMFKRDFYALFFGGLCLIGQARLMLWLALAGVITWFLAILVCAPLIARDRDGKLLPAHLRNL
jgi:phosphatidylglycerophosphate synthase